MTAVAPIVGAVEAGGTKFVCAVGRGPGAAMLAREQFATGDDPAKALGQVTAWLAAQEARHGALTAIGVASFGPVCLDRQSPAYGRITTTPKPGWRDADIVGAMRRAFPGRPVGFDTDVNGAALGEHRWGAARGVDDFVYLTVGTGIGGGAMANGRLVHGLLHPEMGHMPVAPAAGDGFAGACAIHGRCWEGLCAGPAIAARTGMPAELVPADHPAWDAVLGAMSNALAAITCVLSPRRIVLGGSVRRAGKLGEAEFFARLRAGTQRALAGYLDTPALREPGIAEFIVPPALGDEAGVCGAMALAQDAAAGR